MARRLAVAVACGALSVVAPAAGCGPGVASPAEPLIDAPAGPMPAGRPLFIPGEVMVFALSLRGVVGGEAMLSAGSPGTIEGRRVIIVRSKLASTGVAKLIRHVKDDVTSWIDFSTATPIRNQAELEFGQKVSSVHATFRPGWVDIQRTRPGKRTYRILHRLPAGAVGYDAHAVLGAVRAWQPRLGERVVFYVLSGRRVWENELRFTRQETLETPMGLYPAMRLEGLARRMTRKLEYDPRKPPRPYLLWQPEDLNRLPLKVTARTEYGEIAATMTHYQRPTDDR